MFWGLSPSLDLYQEYLQAYKDEDKKDKKDNKRSKVNADTKESKEIKDDNENKYNTDEKKDRKDDYDIKDNNDDNNGKGDIVDNNDTNDTNDTNNIKNNIENSENNDKKDCKKNDDTEDNYNTNVGAKKNDTNDIKYNIENNENKVNKKSDDIEDNIDKNDSNDDDNNNEIDKNYNNDNNDNNDTNDTNNNKNTKNNIDNSEKNEKNYVKNTDDTENNYDANVSVDKNDTKDIKNNIENNENKDNKKSDNIEDNINKNDSNDDDDNNNEIDKNDNNDKIDTNNTKNNGDKSGENDNKEAMNEKTTSSSNQPRSLNILLFGAGDPRHVIQTIAKHYTHCSTDDANLNPELNFYIVEGCIELVARSILLLGVALERPDFIGLRNKVHLFMDIYGNTMMRPTSHLYLIAKAKSLLKMITDDDQLKRLAPFLSIDGLKYRERDGLENSFHFWLPKPDHVFNITDYWSVRLRTLLGTRYDHREGAFDWDLSMTLKYREGKQICSQEYRYWRETGIAFTFPEYEQCKPNKTMSAGLVRNGNKYMHRGYVGDIQTGPFCAFGLRVSDQRFSNSMHGENDYRSTDVTERNLLELFHEIQERKPYIHDDQISRKLGAVKLQMGKILTWNECDFNAMQDNETPWQHVGNVNVNYLSADEIFALQDDTNGRWHNFFDVAFVGHNYFAFIKPSFGATLRPNALLIMETKLMTMARKEGLAEFEAKLKNFAKSANLENVLNYNAINANFSMLKFRKKMAENVESSS